MGRAKVVVAALCLAAGLLIGARQASAVDFAQVIPDEYRAGGYAIGCQAYSFNRYSFFEAVDKCKEAGGKVIELFPGQRLSPEDKTQLNHSAPEAVVQAAQKKLKDAGLMAVAYGVVGLGGDEVENRKVFDFAKKMGIHVIQSEPEEQYLPKLAEMAKEYDIKIALHNHPQPSRYWDPKHVLEVTKDLNEYVGSGGDTGHWMRSGVNPVEAIQLLQGRIVAMHIKDLNEMGKAGHDVPFGTGQANMPAILRLITQQNFKGPMSIEYEYDWEGSVPEVSQCIGYIRGFGQAQQARGQRGGGRRGAGAAAGQSATTTP